MASSMSRGSSAVDAQAARRGRRIPILTWVFVALLGLVGCVSSILLYSLLQKREVAVIRAQFERDAEHRVGLLRQQFGSAAARSMPFRLSTTDQSELSRMNSARLPNRW